MNRLKAIRLAQGKHQVEIADMANIARRSYIRYEADATPPNVLSAIRIADALGVADLREIWNPAASPK